MNNDYNKFRIEYLKSSLSISTFVGCNMGCKYCILSSLKFGVLPEKIADEADLVNDLCTHKFFIKGFTPISINNRTDPFLNPIVKESTFTVLKLLQEKKVTKNPLMLITKKELSGTELEWLDESGLNIYLFLSYSGLPKTVEPNNETFNETHLINLRKTKNIHKIHYWRPIIEGVNNDDQDINKMLATASSTFDCSIVSGIRLSKEVITLLKKNTKISFEYQKERAIHKYLSDSTIEKILTLRNRIYSKYLLFRHTSCVISHMENKPDYNLSYLKPKSCIFGCPNSNNCMSTLGQCNKQIIEKSLSNLGISGVKYHCDGNTQLNINADLTQEEISYLKHNSRMVIVSRSVINSPSESKIVK